MNAMTVQLTACDDDEYREFSALQLVEYASQIARAGEVSAAESLATARERLVELTTDQLRSRGHDFLVARSTKDDLRVGWVWLSPPPSFLGPEHERTGWLSQLTVEASQRGRGWGRAILTALDQHAQKRGYRAIMLRVFDWNVGARHLYGLIAKESVWFDFDELERQLV